MDNHGNPYPPHAPYGYPPPNDGNPNQPPISSPYLSPSASFPSHPHNLAPAPPQYSHSGPLQYPPPSYPPNPYYNPYPPPPSTNYPPNPDPNLNLYPPPHPHPPSFHHTGSGSGHYDYDYNNPSLHSSPSSFHHTGTDQYGTPNLHPNLNSNLNPSSFHHTGSDRYDTPNHLSYPPPPPSHSDSISSVHDGLASMHISDTVATSSPQYQHQRYDSFGSYSNSPVSAPPAPASPFSFSGSQHGGTFSGSQHGGSNQIVPYTTGSPSSKGKSSLKVLLLHGSLDIFIRSAKNLPNKDMFHKRIGDLLGPRISNSVSGGIQKVGGPMTSDPYVTVSASYAVIARTYVIDNNENPIWDQHFNVPVAHEAAEVLFTVKDDDVFGAQIIGTVSIPAERIYTGERIDDVFPVLGPNGKPCNKGAVLSFSIQYIPVARLTMYHHGVTVGSDCKGVPNTYFSLRRGGKVTLYQDAHVPDNCLPNFWLENGMQYKHGQCWRDVFDAISSATRLIYIVGWSVFHTVTLVRDGGKGNMVTLGELLKRKSQEGARVCILIWDDPTSRSFLGIKTAGIMGTNDEETRRFFKHSSVNVLLCPRAAGKKSGIVKQQETGTIFTHHQKTIVVDADAGNYRRKIIAFVGGLDLCGGRYDTPTHTLFRTLDTVHKDDYHNPNFAEVDSRGPREPWHDLHSKIDGPAAYDVLKNFEERWLKGAKRHGLKKMGKSYDDTLLNLKRIPEICLDDTPYVSDNDPESWHVQVFRSIDSNSAKDFPKDPREASLRNLVCGKNVLIDMSIHAAYVNAIRAAQHFIYIENQYFLGSSFNWDSNKDIGANNLIPIEIALKIANKIKANERFAAYIVIPMWPEGNPTGAPTQRILHWQKKTMQMMYDTIYRALKEAGLEDKYEPQDYLNFFCLGNRESPDRAPPSKTSSNSNNPQESARKNRRFMIYVHSKGMIVDDEYVIIGSANINQRSLEGTRDTEIAMGAYQPQYTWARNQNQSAPHGQIYGYRMSLWAEHTGTSEEIFNQPQSFECVRRVRTMGELNWKQFLADEVTEMRGHLLKYPLNVDRMGKVTSLPGCKTFPDLGGEIGGAFLPIQENLTI
ncbi:phospholipase D gamma 1-like protein [Carex littledalei]|uniref:phospholipase D n=1 Tax=Carex littledalei TaxID=544730 RepID=A0A833RIX1_9POAL|nr:phospholipase D gamma 1-like protein [Carex littledalei]